MKIKQRENYSGIKPPVSNNRINHLGLLRTLRNRLEPFLKSDLEMVDFVECEELCNVRMDLILNAKNGWENTVKWMIEMNYGFFGSGVGKEGYLISLRKVIRDIKIEEKRRCFQ